MAANELEKTKRRRYPACCDIYEEKGNVVLKMEMPGVSRENLDIKVDGDVLVIYGKKNVPHNDKSGYIIREIAEGDYYHEYSIDDTIDRNKINASLEKGVLTLTLSIKESEKPRKINVVSK